MDWIDPENPVRIEVSWDAFIAESIPDIGAPFSLFYIGTTGNLIKVSGVPSSPETRRSRIELQGASHSAGVITGIGASSRPSYQLIDSILDYIYELGVVNAGNNIYANASDLVLARTSGTSAFPFINREFSNQNPTVRTHALLAPMSSFLYSKRNGSGGVDNIPSSVVSPGLWDDGSGVLQSVGTNNWTIQRHYFFAQAELSIVLYGQVVYGSISLARDHLYTAIELDPILGLASWTTAVIVKGNASDLSNSAQAEFTDILSFASGGGGGAGGGGDMEKATYDTINSGVVDNSEALNGFTEADFVLESDKIVQYEMEILKAPGNILDTLEVGDGRRGFWDATEYWKFATYNGGDDTLKASHTIFDYVNV